MMPSFHYAKEISVRNRVARCKRLITGFPYLFHKQWWQQCGPWELQQIPGTDSPDVRFSLDCLPKGFATYGQKGRFVTIGEQLKDWSIIDILKPLI